jgi:phosphatidylglycerol---prolipoprotein diacylglyceryl transferase
MFIDNINPNLVVIGPVAIRYYGLVYALGFLAAILILTGAAKRKEIKNLDEGGAADLMIWGMLGLVVGARLGHVLFAWQYYIVHPAEIIMIWHGGMAFIGGLLGMFAAILVFSRNKGIRLFQVADRLSVFAPLFLGIGRLANFANGELYGKITNLPWAVNFNGERDFLGNLIYRHPSQLYEALMKFMLFGILLFISRKKHPEGGIFFNFIWIYGVTRFIAEFFREGETLVFGLTTMQYISLAMIVMGLLFTIKTYRKDVVHRRHAR